MRHLYLSFIFGVVVVAAMAGPTQTVGNQGLAATYIAGNLDEVSAGMEGKLMLSNDNVAFSVGKNVIFAPFKQIQNVDLGDVIEVKRKGFHITKKPMPGRRQVSIQYTDTQAKMDRMLTLEMDEDDAASTVEEIELKTGRRRRKTNGDSWWGDSAWKTKRNGNAVKPDAIGTTDEN